MGSLGGGDDLNWLFDKEVLERRKKERKKERKKALSISQRNGLIPKSDANL